MAAWPPAAVAVGSEEDGSEALSCASRKSSGGRSAQSLSTWPGDAAEMNGMVVLVLRRSGRVVKGLSAGAACCCC